MLRIKPLILIFFFVLMSLGAVTCRRQNDVSFTDAVAQVKDFRLMAIVSPSLAFHHYAHGETIAELEALGEILAAGMDTTASWQYFFSTSIATMTSLTPGHVLSMFYHPWSDVALFCEWTNQAQSPKITGVRLIAGDILRNNSKPVLMPLWRRETKVPPQLAVVLSTSETVHSFMNLFGQQNKTDASKWQSRLPKLKTNDHDKANSALIGALFSQSMTAVNLFFNEESFEPVRTLMNEIRQYLLDDQAQKVVEMAQEPTKESTFFLTEAKIDWEQISVVAFATDVNSAYVFLGHPDSPEIIACFWFDYGSQGALKFRRVDFVGHTLSYEEAQRIASAAKVKNNTGGEE